MSDSKIRKHWSKGIQCSIQERRIKFDIIVAWFKKRHEKFTNLYYRETLEDDCMAVNDKKKGKKLMVMKGFLQMTALISVVQHKTHKRVK